MANREGFDLFNKSGRIHFFNRGFFGDKWARGLVLQDTFGRWVCKFIGHSKNTFFTDYPKEEICYRCYRKTDK